MLSSDSVKEIANIFCGDIGDYYTYKSGPKLVSFFNTNFGTKDVYQSGFPSRWAYVYDKINLLNRFSAQHLVEDIKDRGVEPMIEDILDS
jgi:hypothetical protein